MSFEKIDKIDRLRLNQSVAERKREREQIVNIREKKRGGIALEHTHIKKLIRNTELLYAN